MRDDYQLILSIIKGIYDNADSCLKEKIPNPHANYSVYKTLYSVIKTRTSKVILADNNEVTSTYLIPFLDLLKSSREIWMRRS